MTPQRAPDVQKKSPPRIIHIEPSPGTIIAFLLLVTGFWLIDRLLPVILVLVAALIIVGTISPAVRWLEAKRLQRGMSIAIVFSALLLVIVLLITLTIPTLIAQTTSLIDQEPLLRERLAERLSYSHLTSPLADLLRNIGSGDLLKLAASNVLAYSSRALIIGAYMLTAIFLALYIIIDRDRLRGGLFLIVPRTHHIRLSRVMLNLETIVGGYIRGQVITSAFMALFVFLLLSSCQVANALAIAVFAGAADVLPYLGAFLSVGAAVSAAIPCGAAVIVVVLVLMLLYEEFESRFIIPRVYGRSLRLPSSVILFALLTGSVLMGIAGALLALPVAAALLMLIEELRVELPGQQEQAVDVVTRLRDERSEEEYERRAEGLPAGQAAAIAVAISSDRHLQETQPPSGKDRSDARGEEN